MTVFEILKQCTNIGVYLYSENGKLTAKGNTSALSKEAMAEIKNNKNDLLKFLNSHIGIDMVPVLKTNMGGLVDPIHIDYEGYFSWQSSVVTSWIKEQAKEHGKLRPSWSEGDCRLAAMRDLYNWQQGGK